jgi:hypothetical protein
MKNYIVKTLTLIAGLTLVVGCGGSKDKDPLKDFENLNKYGAPHDAKVTDQEALNCSAVANVNPTIVVSEGQKAEQIVTISGAFASQTDQLVAINMPANMTAPKKIGVNKFQFLVTANKGSLEHNQNFAATKVELMPQSRAQGFIGCSASVGIVVVRTNEVPVITKIANPKEISFEADKNINFNVDIEVKNLSSIDYLELFYQFDEKANAKELPLFDLTPAVKATGVNKISENKYRVSVSISPVIVRLLLDAAVKNNPKQTEFEMLTQFKAYNDEAKLASGGENMKIKVERKLVENVETKEKVAAKEGAKK